MSSVIECPSCGRKLRLPEELKGKEVKCPNCGGSFAVEGPHAETSSRSDDSSQPLELMPDDDRPVPLIVGVPPPPAPFRPVLLSSSQDPFPARTGKLEEVCPRCKHRLRPRAI